MIQKLGKAGYPFLDNGDDVNMPTLEELIAACGNDLYNLTNMGSFWQTNFKDGFAGETAGKTPEEAVAELWLYLNQK